MTHRLTTREVCNIYGIHRNTLDIWVKEGCPVARRGKGRSPALFRPGPLAAWVTEHGKNPRGIEGAALKAAAKEEAPANPEQKKVEKVEIDLIQQLKMVRGQYANLYGRFVRLANDGGEDRDVANISRALATKGGELRQLEMSVLEWKQQTEKLVDKAEMQRLFVELASGTRERIMAVPNELAPALREYLSDPADVGKVRDEIDQAIRHALSALPEELPERNQ